MPVDEYFTTMHQRLEAAAAAGTTDEEKAALGWAAADSYAKQALATWNSDGVAIEDTVVDGPHGPIPVRLYRPEGPLNGAVLWCHGGGFRHGDLDMFEGHGVSVELARRAGVAVASVDYRLADGTVQYPVPIDDVHTAWDWWTAHAGTDGPIALGGASAGAALALSTALRTRDTGGRAADVLLLAYPFAHYPNPSLSPAMSVEMAALPFRFEPEGVEEMVRNYVGRISDVPPDALPGAARLDGLPPVRIVVSEYDDLRASADLLERQLREVGVPVESYLALGMTHGHMNHTSDIPEVANSLDFFAKGLKA
ncbi:alpha/beta hydrolase [Glycomyces sp. NPDC048151]|uniref:alpha/beta hydrolase n=1 Tax=Glycomyces sp. NPDC048151 TaxID=3364002 RepID=UPI00371556A4